VSMLMNAVCDSCSRNYVVANTVHQVPEANIASGTWCRKGL
jgi:hypothetical protein